MSSPELGPDLDVHEGLEEEKSEKNKVSVEFFFSPHGTAKDAERLKERIDECDIFVPEAIGWDESGKKDVANLSAGKAKIKADMDESTFGAQLAKDLYGTNKAIVMLDVKKNDPRNREIQTENFQNGILTASEQASFLNGNFEEALECTKLVAEGHEKVVAMRDKILEENIKSFLEKIEGSDTIKESMEKNGKDELKVLIQLGAAHMDVYHNLKDEDPETKRVLGKDVLAFSAEEEIRRKKALGQEVNKDMLAHSVLQHFFLHRFSQMTDDTNKAFLIANEMARHFSVDEIKKISEEAGKQKLKTKKIKTVDSFIEEKGIFIPKSEAEIDKALKKYFGE